ncbi:hypothetical protein L2E82_08195 [Cichorium intybus]|uniref:Uncharacterized protein n=1 Tax=Cichorium intybus TaxID=13427 RepID=A0ACB9G6X5_CICIN|nr:hypothetical protein L2E82_08195 [Cichorium intybus]
MIAMVTMLLWIRVSVLMTTDATFLHSHQMQASHELGYDDHQQVLSPVLSRKLMIQEMVEENNGDQDLLFDNDQKEAILDEPQKNGEEMKVNTANRYDPTRFTSMDYSHVRRRRPIHNNSSPKPNNSP